MAVIGARPASPWDFGRRARPRPRRRAVSARRHGLRVRRPRISTIGTRSLVIAIAAAVGIALFYLTQSTHVAATGYEIDRLGAQLAERRAEQQQLIWEIGRARSPSVIADRARDDLKLVPLEPEAVRFAPAPASEPSTHIDD